jgi:hypothetical protein
MDTHPYCSIPSNTVQESWNFMLHTVAVLFVQFATTYELYTRPMPLNCWNWTVTSDTDSSIKNMFEGQM